MSTSEEDDDRGSSSDIGDVNRPKNRDLRARRKKKFSKSRTMRMVVDLPPSSGTDESSEDGCFTYTYKEFCENSHFDSVRLENLNVRGERERRRASSPEMDFLEMDFDPGQSNGHCSSDSDFCDMDRQSRASEWLLVGEVNVSAPQEEMAIQPVVGRPPISIPTLAELAKRASCLIETHQTSAEPTQSSMTDQGASTKMSSTDDEPRLPTVRQPMIIHAIEVDPYARAIIWNDTEAEIKQLMTIGLPGKGVAAVVNTLVAFGLDFRKEVVHSLLDTLKIADHCNVSKYLLSMSMSYSSHMEIIKAFNDVSNGRLISRFFATFPPRHIGLCSWLYFWIHKGAVPIVTINPQAGEECRRNLNGWQHRMVCGVDSRVIFLTDPVANVSEDILLEQLSRPSVLRISRDEIVSRWSPDTDLRCLASHPDKRWHSYNVLGQVVNIVREEMSGRKVNDVQGVRIPTKLTCGITLVMPADNPHVKSLLDTPDFPLCSRPPARSGSGPLSNGNGPLADKDSKGSASVRITAYTTRTGTNGAKSLDKCYSKPKQPG
ncbi:hypothetical protein AAG570_012617 [Ranatra chinensis]|uniref:Aminotransferase-like plant mobile domain-containing protein n=1 Tax=Ranatra chinensis TaxID=642074 RepID=A0ABD0YQV4_9HEMI